MIKKILKILGALVIVIGSGVAAFFILDAIAPQESPANSNFTSSESTNSPASTQTPVEDTTNIEAESSALKTQQQDLAVKDTLSSISSGLEMYSANNRGSLPRTEAALARFTESYLVDVDLTNPVTNAEYPLQLNPPEVTASGISYQPNFVCSKTDTSAAPQPTTQRRYALSVLLSSGVKYCFSS